MITPQATEIARKLTKDEKETLLRAELDGKSGNYFIRWWHAGKKVNSLRFRRLGLGVEVWSGFMLYQAGLAVKAVLEEERNG